MSAPKIPLVVRKNIRDEFEGKKEELAKIYKELFGEDYKFEVDFPALHAKAYDGYQRDQIGKVAYEAIEDCSKVIGRETNKVLSTIGPLFLVVLLILDRVKIRC